MARGCFEVQKLRIRHSKTTAGIFSDAIRKEMTVTHDEVKELLDKHASGFEYTMLASSTFDYAGNPVIVVSVEFLKPISANAVNYILSKMYGEEITEMSFRVQEKEMVVDRS